MNRPDALVDRQDHQQPLDLAPVAEMDVVAECARRFCPVGGFYPGSLAETREQQAGIVIGFAASDIRQVHADRLSSCVLLPSEGGGWLNRNTAVPWKKVQPAW